MTNKDKVRSGAAGTAGQAGQGGGRWLIRPMPPLPAVRATPAMSAAPQLVAAAAPAARWANGITVLADMPGVSKDKLDLRLETNSLTINGAVSLDVPEGMESRYAEVEHQQYQRTFALSKELDGEQASAELAHGVLKIRIPRTAHAQPRRVQINVA